MFLAPAFLLGLLAIGVPIWLHRVARANPTQHPFASLMFVEASETQRTAQRTLRYWLLLSLRILLLIALVLAFAGPLLSERVVPVADANARLHAIVIDKSLSMQHGERWQRALDEADKVLGELRSSDRVMLAAAEGRRVAVLENSVPASQAGTIRGLLRSLKPGIERLDYGLAMSTADNWLGSPRPPVVLHLISDLQQSAAPLRFADLEPPPQTQLALHDVGNAAAENVFIQGASLKTVDTRSLEVTVRGASAKPQQRQVILAIDGKEYARRGVELPADAASVATPPIEGEGGQPGPDFPAQSIASPAAKVLFSDLKLAAGSHRIQVSLEPADALPQDDRFYAVLEHADPKALLVATDSRADDVAYFGAAIGSLAAPTLNMEQRAPDAIGSSVLTSYSLLVIANTGALPDVQARRIKEYVAAGGSVLATLGTNSSLDAGPLLEGWRIGEPEQRSASVGEIATTHPVLRDAGDWHSVRFFRHRSVEIGKNDKVLITYEGGTPLLIERTIGAGHMLVLTAPVDREWNDLAIHPLFVHFIAEAARYLVRGDASAASTTVGSVVLTGLTAVGGGQIFDPRGERVLGLAQTAAADRLIPDQTGFYEIRGNDGVRWVAVNVDARESDLTPLPATFVQRWQAMQMRKAAPSVAAVAPTTADAKPRSLGPAVLWLAAAFLLAELLLANRYLAIRRETPK
ncbi:MAG TPA: BatA domain-containing protein [Steroidobacteraceae bacterium]|nr:BatA domain-containing protein [Steroidobacteraceae bacterium]